MTLVRKAANQRDFGQGRLRMREQVRSMLHSAPADQLANGAAVVLVELAREMDVVDAHFGGNIGQAQPLEKPGLDDIGGLLEPARDEHGAGLDLGSSEFSQNFQDQTFDGYGRGAIVPRKFSIQPIGEPSGGEPIDCGRTAGDDGMAIETIQRRGIGADMETTQARFDAVLVRFAGRKEPDRAGSTIKATVGVLFLESAFDDKRDGGLPMRMPGERHPGRIETLAKPEESDGAGAKNFSKRITVDAGERLRHRARN